MAWRRTGDKPLSESFMISLSVHWRIYVTQPQYVDTPIGPEQCEVAKQNFYSLIQIPITRIPNGPIDSDPALSPVKHIGPFLLTWINFDPGMDM